MPSSVSARALATRFKGVTILAYFFTRFSTLLVTPSVPSRPRTVVIPQLVIWLSIASGTREAGPCSPPPPVMCICISM